MDMDRRVDGGHVAVLYVGQLVPDGVQGMVINQHDGPHHPLLVVLPLVLRQRVANQVAYRLRPADVPLAFDRAVEFFQELRLQGDADACDPFHDGNN